MGTGCTVGVVPGLYTRSAWCICLYVYVHVFDSLWYLTYSAGIASPSVAYGRTRSLEGQSSREGISSGGEEDGDEEEPWSAREVEFLDSLVRRYGEPCFALLAWGRQDNLWSR